MSDAHKSSKAAFITLYVLLKIAGLSMILSTLFAAKVGLMLLARRQRERVLGLLGGSTLWANAPSGRE